MSSLNNEEQKQLLLLARQTIELELFKESSLQMQFDSAIFNEHRGAFVTLHLNGNLRGCIGIIEASHPLIDNIKKMAFSAAFRDPRFPALTKEEYQDIDIEISVLSPIREIQDPTEVVVGKHGLIITYANRKGLLLPQVATEQKWDRNTFLDHTCLKAGLDKNKWREGAKIEVFEAEVFGELNN